MDKPKMLWLGIDCLDYNAVKKFNTNLPNLWALMQKSTWGRLESKKPLYTASCWSSIFTSTQPETHGVTWAKWKEGEVGFDSIKVITMFDVLNRNGYTCGLFNMPATFPIRDINKWIVAGFPAVGEKEEIAKPVDILNDLPSDFISYTPGHMLTNREMTEDFDLWVKSETKMRNAFIGLPYKYKSVDLIAYGSTVVDRCTHLKGVNHKTFALKFYRAADTSIGQIIEAIKPDYTFITSDHGADGVCHSLNGFILLNGARFKENNEIDTKQINFAPTVLELLGLNIPSTMEGQIIWEAFKSPAIDKEKIKQQLKALGYI